MVRRIKIPFLFAVATFLVSAQVSNPTQPEPDRSVPTPIFRIEVVARTADAVNYLHRGGSTKIDFKARR